MLKNSQNLKSNTDILLTSFVLKNAQQQNRPRETLLHKQTNQQAKPRHSSQSVVNPGEKIRSNIFQQDKIDTTSIQSVPTEKTTYKKLYRKQSIRINNDKPQNLAQSRRLQMADSSYDLWDLTYTFVTLKINHWSLTLAFAFLILVRYYTLITLIYILINDHNRWGWIIIVSLVRLIFVLIVMKISLKIPETHLELILKKYWNCMESEVHQYFDVMSPKKFFFSILRGLVPPQLSFVYIKTENAVRKFQIYSAINYIFASIQCIVYYPFFIIYTELIDDRKFLVLNFGIRNFSIVSIIAAISLLIIAIISGYLLLVGFRRKYGSFLLSLRKSRKIL